MKGYIRLAKRKITKFCISALFIVGISICAYPFIGNILSSIQQGNVIVHYEERVQGLTKKEIDEIREKAIEYNEQLFNGKPFRSINQQIEIYEKLLKVKDDTMGYLEIPSLDINLPIYHGTLDETLEKGVGHLMNTSLPIGGKNTHSTLTGHSGFPTARLFTDLEKLTIGDFFYINLLGDKLVYQVDQILVVTPDDSSSLVIKENEDRVTLLTCTPYGINSHRLLVQGVRVAEE